MSLLPGLIELANDLTSSFGLQSTVSWRAYVAADGAGKEGLEDAVPLSVLWTKTTKLVRKFDGTMGVSTSQLTVLSPTNVTMFDQFTLPDGTTPVIIGLDAVTDEDGVELTQVYFG